MIFVMRTRGNPLRSRPHRLLVVTSLWAVGAAVLLPYTVVGAWFGFVAPPPALLLALAVMTGALAAEAAKGWFYATFAPR